MAEALSSSQGRERALRAVERDVYAASSWESRDSHWSTWVFAASLWGLPPLPVTPHLVKGVAASLKAGQYKSADQCLSRARQEHLRSCGVALDAATEAAMRDWPLRGRGAGPQELKDGFRLEALAGQIGRAHV